MVVLAIINTRIKVGTSMSRPATNATDGDGEKKE